MSLILESEIFTKEITNDTLTIVESYGVRQVSVFCSTVTGGTVLGGRTLGDMTSDVIRVEENDTFTVRAIEGSVIKNLTVTAPSGCTLKVVAQ